MRAIAIAAALAAYTATAAAGCTGFGDCAIGELDGTWRFSYTETDGNCGPIADETAVFDPQGGGDPSCTYDTTDISDDQCRIDMGFACPTADGAGTSEWTLVLEHIGAGRMSGTGTIQVSHPDATCRSTYNIEVEEL